MNTFKVVEKVIKLEEGSINSTDSVTVEPSFNDLRQGIFNKYFIVFNNKKYNFYILVLKV